MQRTGNSTLNGPKNTPSLLSVLVLCAQYATSASPCVRNINWHFNKAHANFNSTFPLGSSARRQKISGLTSCYEHRRWLLTRACTDQERARAASLQVAWILGKQKKPFTDSEVVKECMQDPFCVDVEAEFVVKLRSCYHHWMRVFYNWNSLTFNHQMTCDSHCSRQALKNSGSMLSAKRNFHIQGVLHFFFWQCLAQHTPVSHHSHTWMPLKHTIAYPSLTSICNTACACQ